MLSGFFSWLCNPFGNKEKLIATYAFNQREEVRLQKKYSFKSDKYVDVINRHWWEAQRVQGTDLYKIVAQVTRRPEQRWNSEYYKFPYSLKGKSDALTFGEQKVFTKEEAVRKLHELEAEAKKSSRFFEIAPKQNLARYHWSKAGISVEPEQEPVNAPMRVKGTGSTDQFSMQATSPCHLKK